MISVLTSTTLWFNVVALALLVLNQAEVVSVIPPRFMPYVVAFIAVANAIMRFRTKDALIVATPKTVRRLQVQRVMAESPRPSVKSPRTPEVG